MTVRRLAATLILASLAAEAAVLISSTKTYHVAGETLKLSPDQGATLLRLLPGRRTTIRLDTTRSAAMRVRVVTAHCEPIYEATVEAPARLEITLTDRGYYGLSIANLEGEEVGVLVEISSPPGLEQRALLRASLIALGAPAVLVASLIWGKVGRRRPAEGRAARR